MDPRHWVKVGVRMGEAQLSPLYTSILRELQRESKGRCGKDTGDSGKQIPASMPPGRGCGIR